MSSAAWICLLILLVAVPVAALLFTALWVVRLVQKYRLFSEEEEAPEGQEAGQAGEPPAS